MDDHGLLPLTIGELARRTGLPVRTTGRPHPEQVDAWVELAELVQDPGFRRGLRALATYTAGQQAPAAGADPDPDRPAGAGRRTPSRCPASST